VTPENISRSPFHEGRFELGAASKRAASRLTMILVSKSVPAPHDRYSCEGGRSSTRRRGCSRGTVDRVAEAQVRAVVLRHDRLGGVLVELHLRQRDLVEVLDFGARPRVGRIGDRLRLHGAASMGLKGCSGQARGCVRSPASPRRRGRAARGGHEHRHPVHLDPLHVQGALFPGRVDRFEEAPSAPIHSTSVSPTPATRKPSSVVTAECLDAFAFAHRLEEQVQREVGLLTALGAAFHLSHATSLMHPRSRARFRPVSLRKCRSRGPLRVRGFELGN